MRSGTRPLGRAEADAEGPGAVTGPEGPGNVVGLPIAGLPGADQTAEPGHGADGTLLAVVPIPGTGTSLAIVGYPVAMPGGGTAAGTATAVTAAAVRAAAVPTLSALADGDAARTGLLLDRDQRRVWADGREITLTFQEFELLAFLAAHPATVFTRADLVRQVWQRDFAADSRTVDVHVSRLRQKLGRYGRCLVTEYRVGYQYRP
ncbi:winged helix family transcriptional regulator [Trebonia kvetii]|uniref:Winged helix family transcriptional regulator n=1 Tax=Trebonia kvetii TaxID=2480626 RepID=A0A6P2C149_9ACTN|nr:winged helix-turn-helix domain-containing protein [Trebonia kvetii]TVZ04206.1 winged helix family transcriptional regulator [Trebonia kvetii]